MSGHPHSSLDNQFVAKEDKPVYIQGPVSRVISFPSRPIDGVLPKQAIEVKASRLNRPLSSPEYFKAILLSTNSEPIIGVFAKKRRKLNQIQIILLSMAAITFLLGGYFSFIALKTVRASNLQAANLTNLANKAGSSSSASSNAVSTAKISASTLASYTVAPNLPRYLIIPKLHVDARVLAVGVLSDGSIGTPYDIYDTAWYNESAQPGQPGAMLIDGHISSWTAHGVFYGLRSLVPGDIIQVERGDGTMFTYKVVKSQLYPANNVDMRSALSPVSAQQGLNLVTCAGQVIPGTNNFNERLVVFTTLVN